MRLNRTAKGVIGCMIKMKAALLIIKDAEKAIRQVILKLKEVRTEAVADSDEDSFFIGFFLGTVTDSKPTVIEKPYSDTDWDVELLVNGSPVDFKIDTGADTTVMKEATFSGLLQRPRLIRSRPTVYSPGGKVQCAGKFLANMVYKGQNYQYWITVIKGQYASNLLGKAVAKCMGLVTRVNGINSDLTGDVFAEIGLLNCESVKIELTDDAVPYSVNMPHRVPFPLLPKVEKELKPMLSLDIIEEVTTPTDWCAPMVLAPKRNKDEVRVCVDLKRLNKGVKRECYILPTLDLYPRCLKRFLADSIGPQLPKTHLVYNCHGQVLL